MGAKVVRNRRWLDIQRAVVVVRDAKLTIEAETFSGLTIKGPPDLVDEVRRRVAKRVK